MVIYEISFDSLVPDGQIEMGGFDEGRTMGRLMGKNTEREDAQ